MCKSNNLYIWQVKDLKYLFAYTVPLSAYLSFSSTGLWTYAAVIYAFGIIPALDVLFGTSDENLQDCLLYTSPSPRDGLLSRMPSSA